LTVLLSAGAGWLLMNFLMLRPWDKSPVKVTPEPFQTRSPQSSIPPTVRYSRTLNLAPGQSATVQGTLPPGEAQVYRFEGRKEEELSATLTGENITFNVLRSDLSAVGPNGQDNLTWQGKLPQSDTYTLQVQNRSKTQAQSFELALALSKPAVIASPTVTPTPIPSPTPTQTAATIETTPLGLTPQNSPQRLTGQLSAAQTQRYTVRATTGQVLSAAVTHNEAVTLTIRDAMGQPLNSAEKVLDWQALITEPGTYQIDVVPIDPAQPTRFGVEIGLKQS
jgi:hypothetical protein